MNKFTFSEKAYFIYEKYQFIQNKEISSVIVKKKTFSLREELHISINKKKNIIKNTKNGIVAAKYVGVLGNEKVDITVQSKEIGIHHKGIDFDFIYQEGLITGIFIGEENIGIIKQKSFTKFGLENYYGFVSDRIPQDVLILFLVLFNKKHSKDESHLAYHYTGYKGLNSRLKCNPDLELAIQSL